MAFDHPETHQGARKPLAALLGRPGRSEKAAAIRRQDCFCVFSGMAPRTRPESVLGMAGLGSRAGSTAGRRLEELHGLKVVRLVSTFEATRR
jgi:hypothetical protein